jgi:hypothetical protein
MALVFYNNWKGNEFTLIDISMKFDEKNGEYNFIHFVTCLLGFGVVITIKIRYA